MTTQRLQRAFAWLSVLVLVAGAVVFLGSRAGGGDDFGADARPPADAPPAVLPETSAQETQPSGNAVPRAARVAAGEFILAAVGREDMKKAWRLAHPSLKAQCACTYKQWLTGNINVDYYPVDNLEVARFGVHEARPDYVVLQVALLPEKGSDVKPQTYFIGLRTVGAGAKKKWLVDYWAPYAGIEVPALPEG